MSPIKREMGAVKEEWKTGCCTVYDAEGPQTSFFLAMYQSCSVTLSVFQEAKATSVFRECVLQ